MPGKSAIEWTGATWTVDRGGRRTRLFLRKTTDRPGLRERRMMGMLGFSWCRRCVRWLTSDLVRQGLCFDHGNEYARERYAADGGRTRQRKVARKRGIAPIPVVGLAVLAEDFGGRCAYCPAPATSFDHIIPVSHGGRTERANVVPACRSCNSSKRATPLDEWLARRPKPDLHPALADVLALAEMA